MKCKDLISFIFFTIIAILLGIRTYNQNNLNFYITTFFSLFLSFLITLWLIKNNNQKRRINTKRIKENNQKAKIGVLIIISLILYLASMGIFNLTSLEKITSPIGYFISIIFAITSLIALIKR